MLLKTNLPIYVKKHIEINIYIHILLKNLLQDQNYTVGGDRFLKRTWQRCKIGNTAELATLFQFFFAQISVFLEFNKLAKFHSSITKTVEKSNDRGRGYP